MSDTFDPYEKWLGIPRPEQPPSYYRLLGVPYLASDTDMIANAADQRMIYLRTFRTSEQCELAERLLGEVAAARSCLLDPRRKAAYDIKLANESRIAPAPAIPGGQTVQDGKKVKRPMPRGAVVPDVVPAPVPPPPPPASNVAPPTAQIPDALGSIVTDSQRSLRRTATPKKKSAMPLGWLISLAIGGVGVVGLGLYFKLRGGDPSELADAAHTQTTTTGVSPTGPISGNGQTAPAHQPTAAPPKQLVVADPPVARTPVLTPAERAAALAWELKRVSQSDNLARALAIVRELAELEGQDSLSRQAELFTAYVGRSSSPLAMKQIVNEAGPLVRAAVKADRADVARPCAVQALVAARRLDDPEAIRASTILVLEARKTKTR